MDLSADLNTTWFVLVGVLLTGYAMLDGFDLGVGILHLLAKKDEDRRVLMNAIGPVWDGNEVWLVTGGGALFAAFPLVYAKVFSGFYLAFMALLCALIFRAVAMEFRSKQPMGWWRAAWDVSFSVGSAGASLLIGVALGNMAWGIPLDRGHEYTGGFLDLMHPYALLVGLTTVALFAMHGCIYLLLKTEGKLHERVRSWVNKAIALFLVCYAATTAATLTGVPHMVTAFADSPWLYVVPVLNLLAILNIPRQVFHGRDLRAFLFSCLSVVLLMVLFGIGMYPEMVHSEPVQANSLTIYNAASSRNTLVNMLIIAGIGMPMVLAYTAGFYCLFGGMLMFLDTSY